MIRMLSLLLVCVLAVSIASADEYWIAYEGNDFPENEGWTRIWFDPQAERWIENGALAIDSRASTSTCEWYEWYPEVVDPAPGEEFIMCWRLCVDDGGFDVGVSVYSDEKWAAAFLLDEDTIVSVFEPDVSASFTPNVFHEFELRSVDMRTYELFIDDALAIEGTFWLSLIQSRVLWGDKVQGAASLSRWDYVRFGVAPEPNGTLIIIAIGLWILRPKHSLRGIRF
jgi:hypothetical protein